MKVCCRRQCEEGIREPALPGLPLASVLLEKLQQQELPARPPPVKELLEQRVRGRPARLG
jgi:hypothetical protein